MTFKGNSFELKKDSLKIEEEDYKFSYLYQKLNKGGLLYGANDYIFRKFI